ncbi:MAG: sugar transferase [Ardenticatenia bacterium]|nr:sugar transferase [Ardenticatenia bacterium]
MMALGLWVAWGIRFQLGITVFQPSSGEPGLYLPLGAGLCGLWLLLFALSGLYDPEKLLGGTREYALIFQGMSTGLIVVAFVTFLLPEFVLARAWLLLGWALVGFLVGTGRFIARRAVYALRAQGWFLAPALIVGTGAEAAALEQQLGESRHSGLNVLGFVSAANVAEDDGPRDLFALGGLQQLDDLIARHDVEELVVASGSVRRPDLVEIYRRFGNRPGLHLRFSGGLFEIITTGLELRQIAFTPLLSVVPVRLTGLDHVLKWLLDKGIALAVVALGWPLLLALALWVRLDSPGPVGHRRRVLGLGGKPFDAFKFRSMRVDGDAILAGQPELRAELAREQKLKEDPRVTRAGRFLRRSSLDELPQVFNVLRGEMSIVGPRMISPEEHERYGQWDLNLLTVKPGITGLWQVSGRSDLSYDERVRLDMNYIRNWTIWQDLQILLQTLPAVLLRRGAY